MGPGMLVQRCTVWRSLPQKDEYNTPLNGEDDYQAVNSYPCRLSRKKIQATRGEPETAITEVYMLYMPAAANIQAGDLVKVNGAGEYRAGEPYRPNNHHTEVQVEREGSA
ncbi:DUF3599 family protein [Paenibacillus humicus]|uniref:DUF3599 family protein n=1 Tax=Paenibacillus humicus TaxID=412861 RepID=UPI0013E2C7C7|nr:DUF3599 family protein [Paenibacillus humicus]